MPTVIVNRCRKTSCKFYNSGRKSACNALSDAYIDDQMCKFYKPKKEVTK